MSEEHNERLPMNEHEVPQWCIDAANEIRNKQQVGKQWRNEPSNLELAAIIAKHSPKEPVELTDEQAERIMANAFNADHFPDVGKMVEANPKPEACWCERSLAMSSNTEPVVTQEDRDAADQLRIYLLRKMDLELEDDVIGEFEKHFAAHRAAAVAKREAEIVGAAIRFAGENDKSRVYGSVYASVTLRSFARWVQTGGDA